MTNAIINPANKTVTFIHSNPVLDINNILDTMETVDLGYGILAEFNSNRKAFDIHFPNGVSLNITTDHIVEFILDEIHEDADQDDLEDFVFGTIQFHIGANISEVLNGFYTPPSK